MKKSLKPSQELKERKIIVSDISQIKRTQNKDNNWKIYKLVKPNRITSRRKRKIFEITNVTLEDPKGLLNEDRIKG